MSNQETFGTRFSQIKTELTLSQTFLDLLVELDQKSNKVCSDSFGESIQTMELELLRLLVVIFQQNANWKMAQKVGENQNKEAKAASHMAVGVDQAKVQAGNQVDKATATVGWVGCGTMGKH